MRRTIPLLVVLSLLIAGCWSSGDAEDKSSIDTAFKEVFGVDPPQDVTDIVSSWFSIRDSYTRWIRFSGTEATLSRIRSLEGVKPYKSGRMDGRPGEAAGNANAPSWWTHARVPLELEEFDIDLTQLSAMYGSGHIWIDRESGTVYAERRFSQ